ncbi:hypothetical protein AB4144_68140, partial [Rhizobiaceae sp. 2RAB30]
AEGAVRGARQQICAHGIRHHLVLRSRARFDLIDISAVLGGGGAASLVRRSPSRSISTGGAATVRG